MTTVNNPFPYFPEAGTNGYIYIGAVNQNAQSNPITVYRDAALTIPWQQPIRTLNGYPAYLGAKAEIHTGVDSWSILIKDNQQRVVSQDTSATTLTTDSSLVKFTQAGTGAVERTVQAKLRDTVSVKDFGAVGDGVTDDTAAIQAAINGTTGEVTILLHGNHKISGRISLRNNVSFTGPATVTLYESANPFFFDVSNCSNVSFEDITFDGRRSSWAYPFQTGAVNVDSRSRYAPIYGSSASNITVQDCHFSELYSAAVYLTGSIVSEKASVNGFKIINSSCTNSNFELAKFVACGVVLVQGCRTSENRNSSGISALVGNGLITTACNDVRVTENYLGPCDGNGCKFESVNGSTIFNDNTCELNDFNGVAFQESGIERIDVANHNERVTVSGNTFIRPNTYAVGAESGTANGVWNASVTGNLIFAPVLGGVAISGNNWTVSGNTFAGPSVNRSGTSVCPYGVFINAAPGVTIGNITVSGNTFDKNATGVTGRAEVHIGSNTTGMVVNNINIVGNTIRNSVFRGIWCQNNITANGVLVSENIFVKDTLDGSSSQDIYVFNSADALRWTVCNNTTAQGITVSLTNAGSYAAVFNNKITATESKDPTNLYIVNVGGKLASVYDLGRRLVSHASAAPVSGTYEIGDLVWNSAPTAGGTMGWVCTTAGSPGTWKTFGAIAP